MTLSDDGRQALVNYDWLGNFRQLAHLVKTLVALAEPGQAIGLDNLPAEYRMTSLPATGNIRTDPESAPGVDNDLTPERIKQALEQSHYRVATAARKLGVHRSTLYRYMATYNL